MTNDDVSTFAGRDGWFKSSYSSPSGACVEAKFTTGAILLRDSKDERHNQPVLRVALKEWHSFLGAISNQA